MLIHDRFVFLHMPRTGGRFVQLALKHGLPGCRILGKGQTIHFGWNRIPPEAVGRPVLAFVRNPWDWYVSWYSTMANLPRETLQRFYMTNPLADWPFDGDPEAPGGHDHAIEGNDKAGFARAIRRVCAGMDDGENRAELKRILEGSEMAAPILEGRDLYTSMLTTILGEGLESDLLTVGRFESLPEDLVGFLEEAGVDIQKDAADRVRAEKPFGASHHGPYRDYYDDELRDLVGASCESLIERFDYSF